jgi:hypothetical protein
MVDRRGPVPESPRLRRGGGRKRARERPEF